MAKHTTNYNLIKPDEDEFFDVAHANGNADIVDTQLKSLNDALAGKANADSVVASVAGKTGAVSLVKADVGLDKVDNTTDAGKPISDATALALASKANSSQVLTDVPANAKFTDTVTTINGKTGAIAKADIVALGIPGQDTTYTAGTNIEINSGAINNIITDQGTDPDWAGVKYKFVMINGELFAEVVAV